MDLLTYELRRFIGAGGFSDDIDRVLLAVADCLAQGDMTLDGVRVRIGCDIERLLVSDRLATSRVVFALVGWMTALWDADSAYRSEDVAAIIDKTHYRHRRVRAGDRQILHTKIPFSELTNVPVSHMADLFGPLMPRPLKPHHQGAFDHRLGMGQRQVVQSHALSCRTLMRRGVSIAWTNTLAQHLEFDRSLRVLYVFGRPSILVMALEAGSRSFISKPVLQNFSDKELQSPDCPTMTYDNLAMETLLTLRLLLAPTKRVWWPFDKIARDAVGRSAPTSGLVDPFLESCSTTDARKPQLVRAEIEVEKLQDYYTVNDFPFWGERLFALDYHTNLESPRSWEHIWRDRSKMVTWFTMWFVFNIGVASIVIGVVFVASYFLLLLKR